jgi:hypothetical protein
VLPSLGCIALCCGLCNALYTVHKGLHTNVRLCELLNNVSTPCKALKVAVHSLKPITTIHGEIAPICKKGRKPARSESAQRWFCCKLGHFERYVGNTTCTSK